MELDAAREAKSIVRDLDDAGYIIVPKTHSKPARRGNEVDLGPWIGKSHSARLAGG